MLGRFRPELVPDEIRITRTSDGAPERAERDPEAGRDQPG